MIHPNQSFIDKFNTVNKTDDSIPTHLYGHKFKEKQRKEKFKNFVENKLQPKVISLNEEIKKIFNYNTLSSSRSKSNYLTELKQSRGSLPQQFVYNGLVYAFNDELNAYINQHGHIISIDTATAFIQMAEFEGVAEDEIDDSSTDGAPRTEQSIVSITPPIAPSGLSANMSLAGVTLAWESNSDNETQFKVYSRTELI